MNEFVLMILLLPVVRCHAVELFGELYSPADWSTLVNEDFPEIVQIVNGEAPQANASQPQSQSQARALSLSRSKTLQAIRLNTYVDNASDTIASL